MAPALHPTHLTQQRQGFALVIALSLMAFIVLLLISLSTLTVVELKKSERVKNKIQAEQNALLAVQIALGQLQTTVGPDQRVTAMADILADSVSEAPHAQRHQRHYWTGAWNTDPAHPDYERGEPVAWLVSGDVDPGTGHQNAPNINAEALLVGQHSAPAGQEVYAPIVTVQERGSDINSHAYWVGDEGIKTRYNLPASEYSASAGYNPQTVAPARTGLAILSADFQNASMQHVASVAEDMPRVTSSSVLPLLHPGQNPVDTFHYLSYHSQGVIANTRDGGLKYDLSVAFSDDSTVLPDLVGADLPSLELFRSYYELKEDIKLSGETFSIAPRVQTATQHGVAPVLVMFQGNFGVLPSDASGNPAFHPDVVKKPSRILFTMRPWVVLANPYDVDLEAADYEVVWEPEMYPASGFVGDIVYVVRPGPKNKSGIPNHELRPFGLFGGKLRLTLPDVSFKAGEIRVFTLARDGVQYSGSAEMTGTADNMNNFLWVDTGFEFPASSFTEGDSEEPDGLALDWDLEILQGFNGLNINAYWSTRALPPSQTRFTLKLSGQDAVVHQNVFSGRRTAVGRGGSGHQIKLHEALEYGYHARFSMQPGLEGRNNFPVSGNIYDPGGDDRGMAWLANANMRSPVSDVRDIQNKYGDYKWNAHPTFHWMGEHTGWSGNQPSITGSSSYIWILNTDTTSRRAHWGSHPVNNSGGQHFVTLFHVPRDPLLSLGELKHVNASPHYGSTYAVGNSWASMLEGFDQQDFTHRLNEALWDGFFFSGYDQATGSSLNPRVSQVVSDSSTSSSNLSDPEQAASALVVEGAFNVNSTSVESWKAMLASLRDQDVTLYLSGDMPSPLTSVAEADLENPILPARMPSGYPLDDATSLADQKYAQWNGFRDLSDDQIESIAHEIVEQVRARGPFLSLSDFVNRSLDLEEGVPSDLNKMGALQAAIEKAQDKDGDPLNPHIAEQLNRRMGNKSDFSAKYTSTLPNEGAVVGLSTDRDTPGYLSQTDLFTMLAPTLTVRSDTFKIRAYGSWENSLSGESADTVCEAIVQRIPAPVTPDVVQPTEPSDDTKQTLGRQFQVVSFRWLSPNEI